jgi:hypothetical protein
MSNFWISKVLLKLFLTLETYVVQFPKIVVKGLFWGSGGVDNGGDLIITCKKTNLTSTVSFGSSYKVGGFIIDNTDSGVLYKISGSMKDKVIAKFENKLTILSPRDKKSKKEKTESDGTEREIVPKKVLKKIVTKVKDQQFNESRKLWYPVTDAIIKGDTESALKFKSDLEEQQRSYRKVEKFEPKLFKITDDIVQDVSIYEFIET